MELDSGVESEMGHGSYWSDTPSEDVRTEKVPVYKAEHWTAPDFPKRAVGVEVKKVENAGKIAECRGLIAKYQRDKAKGEEMLMEVQQRKQERARLEGEREEIRLKIRKLERARDDISEKLWYL